LIKVAAMCHATVNKLAQREMAVLSAWLLACTPRQLTERPAHINNADRYYNESSIYHIFLRCCYPPTHYDKVQLPPTRKESSNMGSRWVILRPGAKPDRKIKNWLRDYRYPDDGQTSVKSLIPP